MWTRQRLRCLCGCCSRSDVDNRIAVPPTSRPAGTYPYHQVDRLSPSVRAGPPALQYDAAAGMVKSGPAGEQTRRPAQVLQHANTQQNSWINSTMVS